MSARARTGAAPWPQGPQLPVETMPARTRLVTQAQLLAVRAQLEHQPPLRGPLVLDRSPVDPLVPIRIGERRRDRVQADIEAHLGATLFHDPPSSRSSAMKVLTPT